MITEGKIGRIYDDMLEELAEAESQHPDWPNDPVWACSILVEEAGEAVKEANDISIGQGGSLEKLRRELIQTGAMAIRALANLGVYDD